MFGCGLVLLVFFGFAGLLFWPLWIFCIVGAIFMAAGHSRKEPASPAPRQKPYLPRPPRETWQLVVLSLAIIAVLAALSRC